MLKKFKGIDIKNNGSFDSSCITFRHHLKVFDFCGEQIISRNRRNGFIEILNFRGEKIQIFNRSF